MRHRRRCRAIRPSWDCLDDRCLLSGSSPTGYTPAQIMAAYGLNAITFTSSTGTTIKGDGTGETIALIEVDHDPNIQSDLATFDRQYGLPDPPNFTVINQAGNQTDRGWSLEESMDVEWAHAIAPGASILVVEAAPGSTAMQELQNLMAAVNAASSTPGVVAVSMSWGFHEFPGETAYDANFTTPGITYVAASGDSPGAEYPAASPDVLAVGGTSLQIDGSGNPTETAWIDSGGGYSLYEAEPSYQQSVQTTGRRSTPDVAFDGDPNTGVAVYATSPDTGQGSWQVVGGTSLGAPAWAAIIAIADQGRALAGQGSLSGATQTLPTLYTLAATDFRSISASNPISPRGGDFPWWGWGWFGDFGSGGAPTVGATANTATGLGSPNGPSLVHDLAASTTTSTLPTPTPTPTPTPAPTPAPTPTPTPTPTKHHHHKRARHTISRTHVHATGSHSARLIKQHARKEHQPGSRPRA